MTTSAIPNTAYHVLANAEIDDNPHVCIYDENLSCLACALIDAMGEDRRHEALELASKVSCGVKHDKPSKERP